VGVAGDAWLAINFGGDGGFNVETPSVYIGVGTLSGMSVFGLTGSVQRNVMTDDAYSNVGISVAPW
jgi:hypothetical protein